MGPLLDEDHLALDTEIHVIDYVGILNGRINFLRKSRRRRKGILFANLNVESFIDILQIIQLQLCGAARLLTSGVRPDNYAVINKYILNIRTPSIRIMSWTG